MYEPLLKKEWLHTDTKPVLVEKKNKVKKLKDKFKELRVVIGLKIAGKNIDDLIQKEVLILLSIFFTFVNTNN